MRKADSPFSRLYKNVSPEDFILLFKDEIPQTMAFILSFCPRRSFIKKVIRLLEKNEKNDSTFEIKLRTIHEYLSRCNRNSYDNDLVNIVEEQILIMTDGFEYYYRKKL